MDATKLLIVEDELLIAHNLGRMLKKLKYQVVDIVSSGEAAIQAAIDKQPDLVLMDIIIKGSMNGIEAAQKIQSTCNIPVVYITAYADDETVQQARKTGAYGFIVKPFKKEQLHGTIQIALGHHQRITEMLAPTQNAPTDRTILDKDTFLTLAHKDFNRVCEYNQLFSIPITFSMAVLGIATPPIYTPEVASPEQSEISTLTQETIIQVTQPVLSKLDYIGQVHPQEFAIFFPETDERGQAIIVQSLTSEIMKFLSRDADFSIDFGCVIEQIGAATYSPQDQAIDKILERARQNHISLRDSISEPPPGAH